MVRREEMSNEAARIMESVMNRFKDGIPAGCGVIVAFDSKDFPIVVGDTENIRTKKGGMFVLDHSCIVARRMFGEKIYVVYRKNNSSNIVIDKFSGREIFRELSWEIVETPYFLGQSPHDLNELGLNFIGSR